MKIRLSVNAQNIIAIIANIASAIIVYVAIHLNTS